MRDTAVMKEMLFTRAAVWRQWLASNHTSQPGIWMIFTKGSSPVRSIDYESALDEALCFGWIDSIIRRIDDQRYARKFTPRRPTSSWSEINKKKVARLIRQRRMTPAGLSAIQQSKDSGGWESKPRPVVPTRMPRTFAKALANNAKARAFFRDLARTQQQRFIIWIAMAQRAETQKKRIRESIRLLERKDKLGLK